MLLGNNMMILMNKQKLIIVLLFSLFLISGCGNNSNYKKTYSFYEISNNQIKNTILKRCFDFGSNYNYKKIPCSFRNATVDTFFKSNRGVSIYSLKKHKALSSTEGLIIFYMKDNGILFSVTLFVLAKVTFNPYTGKIVRVQAVNGKTVNYTKSQDLIDSEPALKIFKESASYPLEKYHGVRIK